ncbi:ArsR/SmtB family transcription factor [Roseivivax sediminis]|nr:metalloregulator ArsR/SmtB family transcription factor [Roseivivax sediminis]
MADAPNDGDKVFRALSDPTRRRLLDRLHMKNGCTLTELCVAMDMTRQSVTQHLGLLEDANLISTARQGREKFHFLNPVPLHDVYERWVRKFETDRLALLYDLKHHLERREEMTDKSASFVYVTYIRTTPDKVYEAITTPGITRRYWGHENVSDWTPGATWEHIRANEERPVDIVGRVVQAEPPHRLVVTWSAASKADDPDEESRVTFDIEGQEDGTVRLTVTHDQLQPGSGMAQGISKGWPLVLSSMKSFLETGTGMDL